MKTLIFFFILWIIWKVAKPALDQYLQDVQSQMKDQQGSTQPPGSVPRSPTAATRSVPRSEPQSWELGQPEPGEEGGDELEQWFQEALERKRRIEGASPQKREPLPPPIAMREPERAERSLPPRPERREAKAYPRPVRQQQQEEYRVEHRRKVQIEKKRVTIPREPAAPAPKRRRGKPPAQMMPAAGRRVRRERAAVRFAGISNLDMHDVRKGIILAEILGAPKALRKIDSHTI